MNKDMRSFVVLATKGRAKETAILLSCLQQQTIQPDFTIVIGTAPVDIEGLQNHTLVTSGKAELCLSPRAGLTIQRNVGLNRLAEQGHFAQAPFFCAFFDDDYRPSANWIEAARMRFLAGDIVGLTGHVLADGVKTGGLTEVESENYLKGSTPPQEHWANGADERITTSVYGCNMAFTDLVTRETRFDEALPLYGWQEDRDYTGLAAKIGRVIYYPGCKGVHLGVSSGRVSGIRLGYSQIANPLYLMKKGTMGLRIGARFIIRAILANCARSLKEHPTTDYRGRLYGNLCAFKDIILFRLHPGNLPK